MFWVLAVLVVLVTGFGCRVPWCGLCRTHGDYRSLRPTYFRYNASKNLKVRQMLKLISAADRMKFFGKFAHRSYHKAYLYVLKSQIKYAKACPECGMIANKIWDRMEKESII